MELSGKPCIRRLQKRALKLKEEIEKLPPASKASKATKTATKTKPAKSTRSAKTPKKVKR